MAKKKKTQGTGSLGLETILFNCREYLRSHASLNDKRDLLPQFGLRNALS